MARTNPTGDAAGAAAGTLVDVERLVELQRELTRLWHEAAIDNPHEDFYALAGELHRCNFQLWHAEDDVRSAGGEDARIARAKRAIDRYNQERNDWVERIDDWIRYRLDALAIRPGSGAPLHTETPGSAIDRLSVLALRVYHLEHHAKRGASGGGRESAERKLALVRQQLDDLAGSLHDLLADLAAGRRRHVTYRFVKLYNDPSIAPCVLARCDDDGV